VAGETANAFRRVEILLSLPCGSTVRYVPWNAQIDLRAKIDPGPDVQRSAHDFSPLTHSGQPEVSGGLLPHNLVVNPLSVIADAQAELPLVVTDLHDDPFRLRVADGVP
jgi:hypothetical protein